MPDDQALRERGAVNVRELIRFELENQSVHLPPHKRVLSFDVWLTPLPRTTTGKLRRHEIQRLVLERAARRTAGEARPLTPGERDWLTVAGHAEALAAVAAAVRRPAVAPDANLELDLGLDSMERVEVLTMLERRAGVRLDADARAAVFTVRQLVEAVERARRPGARPVQPGADRQDAADAAWNAVLADAPDASLVARLDRSRRLRAAIFFVVLRVFSGFARALFRFRTTGLDHLPARGPFVLAPNHQSFLDGVFLAAALPGRVLPRLFFVGAAEYLPDAPRAVGGTAGQHRARGSRRQPRHRDADERRRPAHRPRAHAVPGRRTHD